MRPRKAVFIAIFLALCLGVNAQTPGSTWGATGNSSPTEKDNIIKSLYLEQGFELFHEGTLLLVPYASLTGTIDTKGYEWDNRVIGVGGVKLVKNFPNGMISFGTGYATEYRKGGMRKSAPLVQATYWFGWNQCERFPGSSWGVAGYTSPVERNNFIATSYAQQGVRIAKIGCVSIVPFVEGTVSGDSEGYDWNNRAIYGGGIKAVIPGKKGVSELGTSYQRENRFKTGVSASTITLFAKFWFGWR